MPTFEELKQRYMATGAEGGSLSSPSPRIQVHSGCAVTPHVHGRAYFPALKAAIEAVSGRGSFIYIAGWWFATDFSLDGTSGARLTDLLAAKARAGVDVRVLGWVVAPQLMQSSLVRAAISRTPGAVGGVIQMLALNEDTMNFALALRNEPALADKAVLNVLSHPAGAVHMKFALVGDDAQATGFTGGLDLRPDRWDSSWHDVQAEVRGPVCQGFYDAYRDMWNEIRNRPRESLTALTVTTDNRTDAMPDLPQRSISSTSSSRIHAQSLRTLPQYRFSTAASVILPTNRALSYAPNGVFEIKAAWQKAVSAATRYIYVEDQGFTSRELCDWLNRAIKDNSQLRVVLVTGMPDPNDDPGSPLPKFFSIAVNDHLLAGLDPSQVARVGVFKHRNRTIHSKTTIVDDNWALVGSANSMRRSLYTDFEHSVAFMDEAGAQVGSYRTSLWREHTGQSLPDLQAGLNAWFAIPYAGSGGGGTAQLDRLRLPLTRVSLNSSEQALYDMVYDVDSRQDWGSGLLSLFTSSGGGSILSP